MNTRKITLTLTLSFLFSAIVFLPGCGKNETSSTGKNSNHEHDVSLGENVQQLQNKQARKLIRALKLVEEEYKAGVQNGEVDDKVEFREAKLFTDQSSQLFKDLQGDVQQKHPQKTSLIKEELQKLSTHVQNRHSVEQVEKTVQSLLSRIKALYDLGKDPDREKVLSHYRNVKKSFQATRTSDSYQFNIFTSSPRDLYQTDQKAQNAKGADFYLGVSVRDRQSYRYLPGSTVKAVFSGDRFQEDISFTLRETWGSFHHYGSNISLTPNKLQNASIEIQVSPPAYGRHAEMHKVFRKPASVSFQLTGDDALSFQNPETDTTQHSFDEHIGKSVILGLGESRELKTVGPYRVGFIVEGGEPFWIQKDGSFKAIKARSKQENHVEIVLLDRETNSPIPHANIQLTFHTDEREKPRTARLYPLLAEFYHYGNNIELPAGSYRVEVSITPEKILTTEKNRFPSVETSFEWTKSGSN